MAAIPGANGSLDGDARESGSVERPLTAAPGSLRSVASHVPLRKVRAVTLRTPYLLFIGDAHDQLAAKTAAGIAFWRPEICLGQLRMPGCKADLQLPDMTIEEAAAAGVKTVIVGTTTRGGVLGQGWEGLLVRDRKRVVEGKRGDLG